MPSDLDQLLDMGFEKTRVEIAVKKSGGRASYLLPSHSLMLTRAIVQGALTWLEKNQDKSIEDIQADQADEAEDDEEATKAKIAELESGQAKSMVCNECGKKFRSVTDAEFHATKT